MVRRLRHGDPSTADAGRYDFANAIRLLAAHRDTASQAIEEIRLRLKRERSRTDNRTDNAD